MLAKVDEFLNKLNDNNKSLLVISTFASAIIIATYLDFTIISNFAEEYDTLIFMGNILIISTIITFLKLKCRFSKRKFSTINLLSISFIIAALFIDYLSEKIIDNNNLRYIIGNTVNIFIWYSIAFNPSFIFLKKRTVVEKEEQKRTYVSRIFLTVLTIFILLLSNIFIQNMIISFCIALFLPILIITNEIQNKSQSESNKSHLLLILFTCLFWISIQMGLMLNTMVTYNNFLGEVFIFICLGLLSFRNFKYLSYEFKNMQNISINLARKMGELSMMHVEAQKAQIAKENFLETMSHEIRTPVNGIIGHAELLADTETTDEQQRLLGMITVSSKNLMKLIDEVLDLPNLISGNIILSQEEISIAELVESVIDVVSPKSFEKGLDLTYFIEPSVPQHIIGDQKRIGQILLNLSNNALKFTDTGEVFIGVTQIDTLNNEVELLFEVKDTGVGIPASKIKKLFKAYSQTDASISRKYGGTGLGLAISAQLIELMKGKIWAESVVGKGTRFLFTLKCKIGRETPIPLLNMEQLNGIKCLVISENPTMRYILTRRFRQWKFIAKIVRTFEEAQHLIGVEEFQILIVDIVNDSKKASMFLKANQIDPTNKIPSIALINLGKYSAPNLHLIVNETITKPLKTEILAKKIKKFFNNNSYQKSEKILQGNSDLQKNLENKDNNSQIKIPIKILVAEDNPVNQKLIMSILKKLGHNATLVENGKLAIEEEKKQDFDLILMDLQMPIMDGLDATRNIIINSKNKKKPKILALTANAMPGDRERCLEAGMDDYITKPVQIKTLSEKIEKWVPNMKETLNNTDPIPDSTQKPNESPSIVENKPEIEKIQFKILVAEDNLVNQKLIMSILKKMGHTASLAENGALAVEAALKESFEIIIMDLQMPVMDGLEAARQIKTNDAINPKPKIIALTANAMDGDRERCLNAGMDDYITKPIQIKILDETLKKWGKKKLA